MTKIDFSSVAKRPTYGSTNSTVDSSVVVSVDELPTTKLERGSLLLGFYVVFYACFLVSAAAVFVSLEAPEELEVRGSLIRMRQQFLTRFPNVRGKILDRQLTILYFIINKLSFS